jgi:hypothetical protein
MTAIAAPADSPPMKTCVSSTLHDSPTCRAMPAIREGSSPSRCCSDALNQFQQLLPLARTVLSGVGHQKAMFFGQRVHPGAPGEVVRVLLAPMKHHDERHRFADMGRRDVELVVAVRGAVRE